MSDCDIVVVGGGIWGLSTAFHLAEMGCRSVRVLERNNAIALETTPRAAGLVGQIRTSQVMCRAIQYALQLFEDLGERTTNKTDKTLPAQTLSRGGIAE